MGVTAIEFSDPVWVDTDRLNEIYDALDIQTGEAAICVAMEDVASLIRSAHEAWAQSEVQALRRMVVQIAGIADRIGLDTLAMASRNIANLCEGSDDAALAATMARLVRLGERSLIAIWQAQDLSV